MKKMENSPCLLSLLLYRPNLKNIYETRPFKTACMECTKNGCNIIWTFVGNIIFLLYIKKACPTLSLNYRKRSTQRHNKNYRLLLKRLYEMRILENHAFRKESSEKGVWITPIYLQYKPISDNEDYRMKRT